MKKYLLLLVAFISFHTTHTMSLLRKITHKKHTASLASDASESHDGEKASQSEEKKPSEHSNTNSQPRGIKLSNALNKAGEFFDNMNSLESVDPEIHEQVKWIVNEVVQFFITAASEKKDGIEEKTYQRLINVLAELGKKTETSPALILALKEQHDDDFLPSDKPYQLETKFPDLSKEAFKKTPTYRILKDYKKKIEKCKDESVKKQLIDERDTALKRNKAKAADDETLVSVSEDASGSYATLDTHSHSQQNQAGTDSTDQSEEQKEAEQPKQTVETVLIDEEVGKKEPQQSAEAIQPEPTQTIEATNTDASAPEEVVCDDAEKPSESSEPAGYFSPLLTNSFFKKVIEHPGTKVAGVSTVCIAAYVLYHKYYAKKDSVKPENSPVSQGK